MEDGRWGGVDRGSARRSQSSSGDERNIEPIVAQRLAPIDRYIVALSDAQENGVDRHRIHGYKVGLDDRHRMVGQ